jgi:DNA-binding CsgD family transcriptional regulator
MSSPSEVSSALRQFCFHHITARTQDLDLARKNQLVQSLLTCPFKPLMQAWAVFDLYQFLSLHEEGHDLLFGWPDYAARPADYMELVHPDDLVEVGRLYQKALETFIATPSATAMRGRFCISFRMRHHDGHYRKVMETISTLACDQATSTPLVCLRQLSGVDAIWSGESVRHEFQLMEVDELGQHRSCQSLHFHRSSDHLFHPQELRIAQLIRKGLPSKAIADHVCLSKHSVDRYRKLLLQKTNSRNTAAAISHLERLGLI